MGLFSSRKDKEKRLRFFNLYRIALADGILEEHERQMLIKLGQYWGLEGEEMSEIINHPETVKMSPPNNIQEGILQLMELIELMISDGEIADEEYQLVLRIAPDLLIPQGYEQPVVNKLIDEMIAVKQHRSLQRNDIIVNDVLQIINGY